MKQSFTFAEMAKIFSQVEKVQDACNDFAARHEEYAKLDEAFDDEFAKYNYSFFKAPQELHDMFDAKSSAMLARDKAQRKAYRAIKDFGTLIGIGENYVDIVEEKVARFLSGRYFYRCTDMVDRVKSLALTASRKVAFNA